MIAKLMTERPTHLRVVRSRCPRRSTPRWRRRSTRPRPTGSPARANSPARSTVKPAPDRPTVALPAAALEAGAARLGDRRRGRAGRRVRRRSPGACGRLGHRDPAFALRDRTQLTSTGAVFVSAVSADGKQLAYITHNCGAAGCTYSVDLQDVGGSATPPGARRRHGGLRARVEPRPPQPDVRRHRGRGAGASTSSPRWAAPPRYLTLRRRDVLGRRRLAADRPAGDAAATRCSR